MAFFGSGCSWKKHGGRGGASARTVSGDDHRWRQAPPVALRDKGAIQFLPLRRDKYCGWWCILQRLSEAATNLHSYVIWLGLILY